MVSVEAPFGSTYALPLLPSPPPPHAANSTAARIAKETTARTRRTEWFIALGSLRDGEGGLHALGLMAVNGAVERVLARRELRLSRLLATGVGGEQEAVELRVLDGEGVASRPAVVELHDARLGAEGRRVELDRRQGLDIDGVNRLPGRVLEPATSLSLVEARPER